MPIVVAKSVIDHLGPRILPPPHIITQYLRKARRRLQQYHQVMQTFDALLREAEVAHGHLCAGQILGVRLAMLGCERLGIDDPKGLVNPKDRKRLVTFIEIDRCATDAIAVVTGCRLGKRAIKFRDWGKMAATFVDLASPIKPVSPIEPQGDTPVYRAIRVAALESSKQPARITCEACGEGINYDREVHHNEKILCEGCASPDTRYYRPLAPEELATNSKAGAETSPPPAC